MSSPRVKVIDGEQHRLCGKCGEWWPDTDDFFYRHRRDGTLRSPCKACVAEQKQVTNATQPCSFPGCNKPRFQRKSGMYTHRCYEHRYYVMVEKPRNERMKAENAAS